MQGEAIRMEIDEQIVYNQMKWKKNAIWSLAAQWVSESGGDGVFRGDGEVLLHSWR